jgi:hypothetical protein
MKSSNYSFPKLLAIGFIIVCTSIAWALLGSQFASRVGCGAEPKRQPRRGSNTDVSCRGAVEIAIDARPDGGWITGQILRSRQRVCLTTKWSERTAQGFRPGLVRGKMRPESTSSPLRGRNSEKVQYFRYSSTPTLRPQGIEDEDENEAPHEWRPRRAVTG